MARWWLQCIAVTVLVGTSMTAWAIPGAVAAPSGTICVNTIDGCVHRTTVDSGSSVKLDSAFKIGIDKWDWRQGRVWVHVVGSATGFEFLSHVRTFAEFPLLQYHTDPAVC